jgi:hypothetical protein
MYMYYQRRKWSLGPINSNNNMDIVYVRSTWNVYFSNRVVTRFTQKTSNKNNYTLVTF